MTVRQALVWASKLLRAKSIDSPNLDAEVLLVYLLKKSRAWLFAHPEKLLRPAELKKFQMFVRRRARHEPIAYIIGKKEFYGREFFVDKNVLIPRPETETLVEEVLKILPLLPPPQRGGGSSEVPYSSGKIVREWGSTIVDVGTGSGCIAITLAKELEEQKNRKTEKQKNRETEEQKTMIPKIFAVDSSQSALAVAKKNAKKHHAKINFLHGDLLDYFIPMVPRFEPWDHRNLVVVANLPYLTPREWQRTAPEIKKYEPRSVLIGGKDGLGYYRELLKQIYKIYRTYKSDKTYNIWCFFEINPWQRQPLSRMIRKIFPNAHIKFIKDLGGSVRICKFLI